MTVDVDEGYLSELTDSIIPSATSEEVDVSNSWQTDGAVVIELYLWSRGRGLR